jgi:hypothetical protein
MHLQKSDLQMSSAKVGSAKIKSANVASRTPRYQYEFFYVKLIDFINFHFKMLITRLKVIFPKVGYTIG